MSEKEKTWAGFTVRILANGDFRISTASRRILTIHPTMGKETFVAVLDKVLEALDKVIPQDPKPKGGER